MKNHASHIVAFKNHRLQTHKIKLATYSQKFIFLKMACYGNNSICFFRHENPSMTHLFRGEFHFLATKPLTNDYLSSFLQAAKFHTTRTIFTSRINYALTSEIIRVLRNAKLLKKKPCFVGEKRIRANENVFVLYATTRKS